MVSSIIFPQAKFAVEQCYLSSQNFSTTMRCIPKIDGVYPMTFLPTVVSIEIVGTSIHYTTYLAKVCKLGCDGEQQNEEEHDELGAKVDLP
jgi:hypothetical protein